MITVMFYNHCVVICFPLHYDVIMDIRTCVYGVISIWVSGAISGVLHVAATFSIHFCGSRIIHQFFCNIPKLLRLSCSNEYLVKHSKKSRTMDNFNVSGFLLLGFSAKPEQEIFYASVFLVLYVLALAGNMLIITTTSLDDSLQSPMYFFLKHLSLLDLCYISVTVPRFIYNSFKQSGNITLWECIVQCFAFITCCSAEVAMLTLMSYDRYVAICLPLRYEIIMNVRTCVHGVVCVWVSAAISGTMHTAATFSMKLCGPRIIHQFFCDIPQILKLSCTLDYIYEVGVSVFLSLGAFLCVIFIAFSYVHIFSSVLRMPSAEGRAKAFSTCIPHLIVVLLFLSTGAFEYLKSHSDSPTVSDIFITVMYTVVPPTFNPMIYSLRNKAVKSAIRKVFKGNKAYLCG
ncbi:olfactory receptor 14J1-like [Sorex fumeus]|uniref:olfactory receptor 14J1-like n=1 Tax=Sorex fumeus TaxID=62283 RepID=UPI0024ADA33F|nr:olfactory receptor 14J1-like [Sorex fumeus]